MPNKCLVCKTKLRGRPDKKFCNSQCRSTFNNKLNSDSTNFMRNINNVLRKNWRILKSLNPKGKTKLRREILVEHGFNFNYFTNVYRTRSGNEYHFCYDEGFLELDNDMFALVKRQEYVK